MGSRVVQDVFSSSSFRETSILIKLTERDNPSACLQSGSSHQNMWEAHQPRGAQEAFYRSLNHLD